MNVHVHSSPRKRRRVQAAAVMATAAMALAGLATPALATEAQTPAPAPANAAPVAGTNAGASTNKVVFPGNDGKHHTVTMDGKSMMVDGKRLNVWSGEFHYWREPSPNDWRDIFQKMRANGFNAVSLYFFWGLHSTESGKFDFSGIKNIDLLLTMAAQEGLYVIARPGPYINAEISMGGLPAYLTKNGARSLRSMDPQDLSESLKWIDAFDKIAVKHQVTDGGGSIVSYQVENEMLDESADRPQFIGELIKKVKADGITVPLYHNDYALNGAYNPGSGRPGGNIGFDYYAFDQYPLGFNCASGRGQIPDIESRFRSFTTKTPISIAEGQGGAFTPWGASFNASDCANFVDPAFTRQYGVNNLNNGVNMFNYYMEYGGTNWGWTGAPSAGFTSYDYGAAINEDRQLTPKAAVQKELGYFQKDFDPISSMVPQTPVPVTVDGGNGTIKSYQRIATDNLADGSVSGNGARYLGFRQSSSNSTSELKYSFPLTLSPRSAYVGASYTTDDTDTTAIKYTGSWTHASGQSWTSGDYKDTETFSNTTGDSLEYKFTGAGIKVIAPEAGNHGIGDVYIDGVKAGTFDTYGAQNASFQVVGFQKDGLDPSVQHTIKIVVTGQSHAGSNGTYVSVDAFDVIPGPGGTTPAATQTTDDTDTTAIAYTGAWEHASGQPWTADDYQGTETFSETTGDSLEYKFTGSAIKVIVPQASNHGIADVYLDGTKVGTIDSYADHNVAQVVGFQKDGLDPNVQHTIKLVVTGQSHAGSNGTYVSVDSFEVTPAPSGTTTDDTDTTAIAYTGAWEHASGKDWTAGDYQDTETFSDATGDSLEYKFKGTGIKVIVPQASNHGIADVYLDGAKVGSIDSYAAQNAAQVVGFQKDGLDPNVQHTIKLVVTGQSHAGSNGTYVSLDAFQVAGAPDTTPGAGSITFPRIPQKAGTFMSMHGRDASMVIADYAFDGQKLMYSTSELFAKMPVANGTLLMLDGSKGDDGETVLQYASEPQVTTLSGAPVESTWDAENKTLRLNYVHGNNTAVKITGGGAPDLTILTTDRSQTGQQWVLDGVDAANGGNKTVLATGVDLLRTASFDGNTVNLTGDTKAGRTINIYAPTGVTAATWNGQALDTTVGANGQLVATLAGPAPAVLPALNNWKVSGENPESATAFDDSAWQSADATTADNSRQGPGPNQGKVLDTDYYGFYEGDTWYRAHFKAASNATSVQLQGLGGNGSDMLVWVNGAYAGASAADGQMHTFTVPAGVIKAGQDTVVSTVVRNNGQNTDWGDDGQSRENRGLYDAILPSSGPVTWKLQGAKDKAAPVDTARTMYNVGGLYGERAGWYLPNYPDSAWAKADSFKPAKAGITWYRTSFNLDIPAGTDTALGLKVNDAKFTAGRQDYARAVFYVNGWNIGTWVGNVGPQDTFTIPRGFLNANGKNTLAVALTTERDGQGPDSFTLVDRGTSLGGVPTATNQAPDYTTAVVTSALAAQTASATAEGVAMTASGTVALAKIGDGALAAASVDFGDGSAPVTVPVANGKYNANHAYTADGKYTAKVTIKDAVSGAVLGAATTSSVHVIACHRSGNPHGNGAIACKLQPGNGGNG